MAAGRSSLNGKQAFTLLEILIVLIIVGISVAMMLPNLIASIEQTKAQAAKNNLLAIAAAQQRYYEDNNNNYSVQASCAAPTSAITTTLYTKLRLGNISTSDSFNYCCSGSLTCIAMDSTLTLSVAVTGIGPGPVSCAGPIADCPN